jgi:hypothetical protein
MFEFITSTSEATDSGGSFLSYVGTLLAGVLGGAIGGAVISATHERAERFRERMITAATDFLNASNQAAQAFYDFRHWLLSAYRTGADQTPDRRFVEVIEEQIGREPLLERRRQELAPARYRVHAAVQVLSVVFAAGSKVTEPAKRMVTLLEEELRYNSLGTLPDTRSEYVLHVTEFSDARNKAQDEFTAAAQAAIRRRWFLGVT